MKPLVCPRSFEVEALRDGRLTGVARESFERHLELCRECSSEAEALEALALSLRQSSENDGSVDQLHLRRERTRLLAAFDRSRLTSERPPRRFRAAHALAVALALTALLVIGWHLRPVAPQPFEARATVHTQGPAVWSRHLDPTTERVILDSGTLEIQVRPSVENRRFLVVLPDGELEDIGTTFTVAVQDMRTKEVRVREGSVLLRLRGRAPLTIGAGEVWSNAAAPPSASMTPPAATPSSEPAATPAHEPAASVRTSAPREHSPAPQASTSASAKPVADPSLDFRAATALLGSGDNVAAAAAFASFLGKHPSDARSEDAAYLRVIALQRAGDAGGTQRAATEYLSRYPAGFRRAEVERLSR